MTQEGVVSISERREPMIRRVDRHSVIVEDYEIEMFIGLHDFEMKTQQRVLISVELDLDDPERFWDYDRLVDYFEKELEGSRISTQEELCEQIIGFVETGPHISKLRVKTKKPDIFKRAAFVGVEREIRYKGSDQL